MICMCLQLSSITACCLQALTAPAVVLMLLTVIQVKARFDQVH